MNASTPQRLQLALLMEAVSGDYCEGERFLSHRIIRQRWRVAAITAKRATLTLRKQGIIQTVNRSGNYLSDNFRSLALLQIHNCIVNQQLAPLPTQVADWKISAIHKGHAPARVNHIAIILVGHDNILLSPSKGIRAGYRCMGATLTIRGICTSVAAQGLATSIYHYNGSAKSKADCIKAIQAERPLGVIIVRRMLSCPLQPLTQALEKRLFPVVTVFGNEKHTGAVTINFNNIGCGYNVAKKFIELGHRNLATLTTARGRFSDINSDDRIHGFRQSARQEKSCTVNDFIISRNHLRQKQVLEGLLKSGTTAIFSVGSEPIANLLAVLQRASLSIPADFSVIACAGRALTRDSLHLDIAHLDFEALGHSAVDALQLSISGQTPHRHILVSPQIIPAGSVRPIEHYAQPMRSW